MRSSWRRSAMLGFLAMSAAISLMAQTPAAPGGQTPAAPGGQPPAAAQRPVYQPDALAGEKNFVVGVQIPFLWGPLEVPPVKVPEGFTPIFNGQNLIGWHASRTNIHGTTPNFYAQDGLILGTQSPFGGGGILLTDKTYKNFELYMEVKPDYGCDSGIFFRCTEAGHCYQITMDYLPGGSMGSLILEQIRSAAPGSGPGGAPGAAGGGIRGAAGAQGAARGGAAPAGNAAAAAAGRVGGGRGTPVVGGIPLGSTTPNGEAAWMKAWKREAWNTVRLRVEGDIPHVQVWINDQLITDRQETTNRAEGGIIDGPLAIQLHGGTRWVPGGFWRWRNIGIKELP